MEITLQYFDGCPNWKSTRADLIQLVDELGLDTEIHYQLVETQEAAEEHRFRGSPTVLVDGVDPFANPEAPYGLSCRVYFTESGAAGSPSLDQLRAALSGRSR